MAICTDEFFGLAKTEAVGWGLPGLPMVVVPHPLAKRSEAECGELAGKVLAEVADALTGDAEALEAHYREKTVATGAMRYHSLFDSEFNAPDAPDRIRAPNRIEAINRVFANRGWTDGLPVLPPTPERCEAMLAGRDPNEVAAIVEPRLGRATLGKIAANAVMAGCEPSHFPVVLAAVCAMCEPEFNLKAIQSTTHPCTVGCLVGGPIVAEIDMNGAYNALGQGNRANASIGRALRLILINIGGASPGALDRSTMGSPAKYAFCFAENAEANPWPSHHEELGLDPTASHVTVFGVEGPHNVNDHYGRDAEEILLTVAGTLASPGANNFYLEGQPVIRAGARTRGSDRRRRLQQGQRARVPKRTRHRAALRGLRSDDRRASRTPPPPPPRRTRQQRRALHHRTQRLDRAGGRRRRQTLRHPANIRPLDTGRDAKD